MALMPIERGKVREYALATGAVRPEYLDDAAAPIPPTFLSTVVFWHDLQASVTHPQVRAACAAADVDLDVRTLLSLEQDYEFFEDLPRVGDVLETVDRFDGVEVKRGPRSTMVLVHFAVEFRDPVDGRRRAECRYTSAYRSVA